MTGVAVKIHKDEVIATVNGYIARIHDLTPAMRVVGEIVVESVMRNFEQHRSPDGVAWKKLSKGRVAEKAKRGRNASDILIDTTTLMKSISHRASSDRVVIGTNIKYAAVHQFGAAKGYFGTVSAKVNAYTRRTRSGGETKVKSHTRSLVLPWGNIPARPFLGVRQDDWAEITAAIDHYIAGKGARA